MQNFGQLVATVTRRGMFQTQLVVDSKTQLESTWLVTGQDDIISTDVRSGSMAMIQPADIAELLNATQGVKEAIRELRTLENPTKAQIEEILSDWDL